MYCGILLAVKKRVLNVLKLIGVLLFAWVLWSIDRTELLSAFQQANILLLLVAFSLKFVIYAFKTWRWHMFVHAAGLSPTFYESWKLYNMGLYFALITPAKLGEVGKVAYLQQQGLSLKRGLGIVIFDRLADVAMIFLIGIFACAVLFDARFLWLGLIGIPLGVLGVLLLLRLPHKAVDAMKEAANKLRVTPGFLVSISLITVGNWCAYFTWAVLVARAVGIGVDAVVLVSVFTITGILSLMPIAPSGLGTRDAALLYLLIPYGVHPVQPVALAMLMFISIVLSCMLGGWYALRDSTFSSSSPQLSD